MLTGAVSVFWWSTKLYFITAKSMEISKIRPPWQASGIAFHQAKIPPFTGAIHNLH